MPDKHDSINKIFLRLQSNGSLVLDKEYLWDGCYTPELDPSIKMPPVTIRKLTELLCALNLDWPEKGEAEKLKTLSSELRGSADIIDAAIVKMMAAAKH